MKHCFILFLSLFFLNINAQESNYMSAFPDGIYLTKTDLMNKVPNDNSTPLTYKMLNVETDGMMEKSKHNCFFFNSIKDKKIKDVFAICYQGQLYFQVQSIFKFCNEGDKNQTQGYPPMSFVRVIIGGNNYLYTEMSLSNDGAQGVGSAFGIAGAVIAANSYKNKAVIWDMRFREFNIIRNCKDFNKFIKERNPDKIYECGSGFDKSIVRSAISSIM